MPEARPGPGVTRCSAVCADLGDGGRGCSLFSSRFSELFHVTPMHFHVPFGSQSPGLAVLSTGLSLLHKAFSAVAGPAQDTPPPGLSQDPPHTPGLAQDTHPHAHSRSLTHMHRHTCTLTLSHTHTHPHTHAHSPPYSRTHAHIPTHAHSRVHSHVHVHIFTHALTLTHTRALRPPSTPQSGSLLQVPSGLCAGPTPSP